MTAKPQRWEYALVIILGAIGAALAILVPWGTSL
jgi:hypothetical protein